MLERHGLLGSALQKLSSCMSSTNGASRVPSVVRASENDADLMLVLAGTLSIMLSLGSEYRKTMANIFLLLQKCMQRKMR
jgi:hypothetical protein